MNEGQNGVGVLLKDAQQFMLEKKGILKSIDDDDYNMWLYDPNCMVEFRNNDGERIFAAFSCGIYYSGEGDGPLPMWVAYTPVKNLDGVLHREGWQVEDLVEAVYVYCHEHDLTFPNLNDLVTVFYG